MSLAYYIVLERNIPGFDHSVDGKALAHASEVLDSIAKEINVRPLLSFFSVDPDDLPEEMNPGTLSTNEKPNLIHEEWFAAEEGLKTVRALLLNGHSKGLDGRILDDLKAFQNVLSAASKNRIRWHLAVDY